MATIAGAIFEVGGGLRAVQGTITADLQQLYGSATWNAGGVTFTALMVDITDTASAAASLLANLKVGGNSKFKVDKAGAVTITSASAAALALGLNGATNPAFLVDASTASSATGLKVKSAAAGNGVAISVITSGTNETLTIDAAGNGTVQIASQSTGATVIGNGAGYMVKFCGTTSAFPALKRAGGGLQVRLADDSGFSNVELMPISAGTLPSVGAGEIAYGNGTQTTVGAAGGASALPATPTGYIIINIAGTDRVIPFYAKT